MKTKQNKNKNKKNQPEYLNYQNEWSKEIADLLTLDKIRKVTIPDSPAQIWVTSNGEVFSLAHGKVRKLKPYKRKDVNYEYINVLDHSNRKENGQLKNRTIAVHRLVYSAFHNDGILIEGRMPINHIDNDGSNNDIDNLERISQRENLIHARGFINKHFTWVTHIGNRFVANYRNNYIGCFKTPEEASHAVKKYLIDNNIEIPKYAYFAS